MVGRPLALQMVSALMRAFSSKVVPVSIGFNGDAQLLLADHLMAPARMRRSSRSLPAALPVAAPNAMFSSPAPVELCTLALSGSRTAKHGLTGLTADPFDT